MTLQLQYSFKETSSDAKILKTYIFQNKALDTVCLKINVSCYFVTMLAYIPLSIHVESEKWTFRRLHILNCYALLGLAVTQTMLSSLNHLTCVSCQSQK